MKKDKVKILIADDNPEILKLIQANLSFEGYTTYLASDGGEALRLAQEVLPDLIILDVLMPVLDGWQVLSHLKKDRKTKDIPVIMLTGVSMKEGKERKLIEDVEDYLSKPFNPLRLLEIVEEVVYNHRLSFKDDVLKSPIKIAFVCGEKRNVKILESLLGSKVVELVGVYDVNSEDGIRHLAESMGISYVSNLEDLLNVGCDLILDMRDNVEESFLEKASSKGIQIQYGLSAQLFKRLVEEQELSHRKERSLVKELNTRVKELSILNEMAQVLTSPLDLWLLLDKISFLSTRIPSVDACAIIMYDKDLEKFTVFNTLGLGGTYRERVKISISDPLMEEILALNRPVVIDELSQWDVSVAIREAIPYGMKSMAALALQAKEKVLGLILVFSTRIAGISKEDVGLLSILAGQAGIAIENAHLYESARQKQQLVEKLLSKLIQAQEKERKRIAAEIHDTIAQSLVGIHTRIQACLSMIRKEKVSSQLEKELYDLKDVVIDNVKEVRRLIFNLRPSSLDDLGLIPSLENYIKRFKKETGIDVQFIVNRSARRLNPSVETALFRIIQEALTNIQKHSQAKRAYVKISFEPKSINLRIADDGKGFEWDKVTEKFLAGESYGLQGMKERVSLLGGSFKVDTKPGEGTQVSVEIPIIKSSDKMKLKG